MIEQRSAGFILFYTYKKNVSYLILHSTTGYWDFPKGKIESGEDDRQAACRELKEETGLVADVIPGFDTVLDYVFRAADAVVTHKTVHYFLGKARQQSVTLSSEHQDYAWLSYDEAMQRVTYKNSRSALTRANQFLIDNNIV